MKKNVILFLLVCIYAGSCRKDKRDNVDSQLSSLKEPKKILNEFAKGELAEKITHIRIDNSDNTTENIYFTYKPDSKKVEHLLFQGKTCFDRVNQTVFYNDSGLIDRIESVEYYNCYGTTLKIFKYNYKNGYLRSIISDNGPIIFEQYFSYNEDGTIEKLLGGMWYGDRGTNPYTEAKFEYDSRGNISRVTALPISNTEISNTVYTYDNNINPLKGFILTPTFRGASMTNISCYSKNNVLSENATLKNGHNIYNFKFFAHTDSNRRLEKLHIDTLPEYWLVYNYIYN